MPSPKIHVVPTALVMELLLPRSSGVVTDSLHEVAAMIAFQLEKDGKPFEDGTIREELEALRRRWPKFFTSPEEAALHTTPRVPRKAARPRQRPPMNPSTTKRKKHF